MSGVEFEGRVVADIDEACALLNMILQTIWIEIRLEREERFLN